MATHTCSSMPIFSKSKQVMPQMVAMRQSHPPNTCIGRLLALSSTIFEIGPDMSRSTSGRNRHSISMCPLAVAKSTDAMQLPQGILGRSIRVKILRVSASQQLCPHLFAAVQRLVAALLRVPDTNDWSKKDTNVQMCQIDRKYWDDLWERTSSRLPDSGSWISSQLCHP